MKEYVKISKVVLMNGDVFEGEGVFDRITGNIAYGSPTTGVKFKCSDGKTIFIPMTAIAYVEIEDE